MKDPGEICNERPILILLRGTETNFSASPVDES